MLHGRGLVVEPDRVFNGLLQEDQGNTIALAFANTQTQAMQILKSADANITFVFISTSIPPVSGLDLLKEIKEYRPSMPVIMFDHHDHPRVTEKQVTSLGCIALVVKPQSIHDLISPILNRLQAQNSWKDVAPSKEEKNIELDLPEEDYIAVPLKDFVFAQKSFFNIYLRLSAGKLVKVLNAGDAVEPEFIKKYVAKGITRLYIRDEEQQRYINMCDKVVKDVLKKTTLEVDDKAAKVLHLGENVKQGLYQSGITSERLHYADNFLQHSAGLARQLKREGKKIDSMIDSLLGKDHVTVVVMLSGLLSQNLGFESKKAVQTVGMAALFHDIGLYDLLPNLVDEDPSQLSPEDLALWKNHPKRGVEILKEVGGFDEVVYQTVEQHHLRKRGNLGRITSSQINMVSEIIGVVDEFQNSVLTGEYSEERLETFMKKSLPLFSPQVVEAFNKILKGKK